MRHCWSSSPWLPERPYPRFEWLPTHLRPSQSTPSPLRHRKLAAKPSLLFLAIILFRHMPHHYNPTTIVVHAPLTPSFPRLDVYRLFGPTAGLPLFIGYIFFLPQIRYEDVMPTHTNHSSFLPTLSSSASLYNSISCAFWIHFLAMFMKIELFLPHFIFYLHTVV